MLSIPDAIIRPGMISAFTRRFGEVAPVAVSLSAAERQKFRAWLDEQEEGEPAEESPEESEEESEESPEEDDQDGQDGQDGQDDQDDQDDVITYRGVQYRRVQSAPKRRAPASARKPTRAPGAAKKPVKGTGPPRKDPAPAKRRLFT